jgi:hypothetical protein
LTLAFGFSFIAIFDRGKIKTALGASLFGFVLGAFLFGVVVPAVSAGHLHEKAVPIEGTVKVVNGQYLFKTTNGESWVLNQSTAIKASQDHVMYIEYHKTPSWAAPYTIGYTAYEISSGALSG